MNELLVLLAIFAGLALVVMFLVLIIPPVLYFARWWIDKWDRY